MRGPNPVKRSPKTEPLPFRVRRVLVLGVVISAFMGLLGRSVYLQVISHDYLLAQGEARYSREEPIVATRGMILDRHGEPIAVSTPVDSIWANPKQLGASKDQWRSLAQALEIDSIASLRRSSCCLWRRRSSSHSMPAQPQSFELTNPNEHRRSEVLRRADEERMLEALPSPFHAHSDHHHFSLV